MSSSDPAAASAGVLVEHAADEAGGEVVFSSDGLNPPPVQLRPPPIRQTAGDGVGDGGGGGGGGGVDYANVSVEQAFEAFAGKLYPVEKRVVGTSSSSSKSQKGLETPLERLQRLHAEVKELESDLQGSQQQEQGDKTSLAMLASIQQIKTRLEAQNALPLLHEQQQQQQEALARQIANSTSALNEPLPPEAATATATSLSSSSQADAAILARLQKLETVLGGGGASTATNAGSSNSNASLMQRLAILEKSMSRLDEKELETLTKKAKVIRQDLEAASKARNKLMSVITTSGSSAVSSSSVTSTTSSTSTNIRAEDSKTITDLHDELVQLQGMTQHLPVLAQRLQSLAHLHALTATYGSRLQAIEDLTVHKLPPQVALLEEALDKMELNLQQSAQQMMDNIKALQQRVDKL